MMDEEKILSLVVQYRKYLENLEAEIVETNYDTHSISREIALNHLFSMLPKMENFIKEGHQEKFFRWLGFAQGVLWSFGEFSLNELCNHNRSS